MKKQISILVSLLVLLVAQLRADGSTYLNFTAVNGPATIKLVDTLGYWDSSIFQYSTDGCATWNTCTDQSVNLASGRTVYFKAASENNGFNRIDDPVTYDAVYRFEMSGTVSADGNVMSLLDPTMQRTSVPQCAFVCLFQYCTSLITAPVLPATTLSGGCYMNMFEGCTSLKTAPALPATTLKSGCYQNMFLNCDSLTTAPTLPATLMVSCCYYGMFMGCKSLKNAPNLPGENFTSACYYSMFEGCTSLTKAPVISAERSDGSNSSYGYIDQAMNCCERMFYGCTSLVNPPSLPSREISRSCYQEMFKGCTSLNSAPSLPARDLFISCYRDMFSGCTSLKSIPTLPATTLAEYCYYGMFDQCSSLHINSSLPGTSWQIPASATPADNWNCYMFDGTSGTFTGDPVIGVTYYVESTSSTVDDVEGEVEITLAPNPVKVGETICIKGDFTDEEMDGMVVEILSTDGAVVSRTTISTTPIELDGINVVGTYIVRITTGTGKIYVEKLMVK